MKTYITPAISSKGSVTETTRAWVKGTRDPINPILIQAEALGSVGFQL